LKLKNLGIEFNKITDFLNDLIPHVNQILKSEDESFDKFKETLFDVNYSYLVDQKIELIKEKIDIENDVEIMEAEMNMLRKDTGKVDKVMGLEAKISQRKLDLNDNNLLIKSIKNSDEAIIVNDIFLTFKTEEMRKVFKRVYNKSKCKRCLLITTCQKEKIH